ncbi:oocyte zinc finger protein XlCOF8.4-like [Rana temporaria]|uniref:oocyte zinc finger protein XlCOF8.4-like n=1 Tax=Rana temporaria TaxID=8407 RepID=UPI001AAE06AD|nr:oocyte zinc finger protein XlCOF8.4-like [Rana temporaria]
MAIYSSFMDPDPWEELQVGKVCGLGRAMMGRGVRIGQSDDGESDIKVIAFRKKQRLVLGSALRMEKDQSHDYGPVKKSGDFMALNKHSGVSGGQSSSHSPISVPSLSFLTPERNKKKILEVTQKMIELLTGEVSGAGNSGTLSSNRNGSSNRNSPERRPRPLYSRDSTQEHQEIPQEDQKEKLTEYRIEDREEETYMKDDEQGEEEIPSDTTGKCSSLSNFQESLKIPWNSQGETLINIKVENTGDEEEPYMMEDDPCKKEEIPPEISTGGHPNKGTMDEDPLISPDCEIEVEITFDSPGEDLITPNLHPVLQRANLSPVPSTHGFPDLSLPVAHPTAHTGEEAFTCNECGRSFEKRARLIVHQRSHTGEKPYLCSDCGKCFAQTSHLFRHVKVHSERKPFLCSECGRSFKEKAHLLRHQKIHTGEKPYICPVCGKHFREKANLIQHDISHTGNYPHSCPECGKCFLSKSRLDIHQMSHSGEKPYSCPECGKCFLHKSVFVRHQKIHSLVKPYICSMCGKCFKYQSHLRRHEKNHEGVNSHSCSDCGRSFSSRQALISHQITHLTSYCDSEVVPSFIG